MVRPGGKLAVTTWGPRIFAPAYEVWSEAVRTIRPDLHAAFNPWDRITTPEAVRALFRGAGVPRVDVEPEDGYQQLDTPEDFWTVVLGSGLRWTFEQLGPHGAEQVKGAVLKWLAAHAVDRIETNVIYAVVTRTSPYHQRDRFALARPENRPGSNPGRLFSIVCTAVRSRPSLGRHRLSVKSARQVRKGWDPVRIWPQLIGIHGLPG